MPLSAELQAEVNFGVENSTDTTQAEILENVSAFLSHPKMEEPEGARHQPVGKV